MRWSELTRERLTEVLPEALVVVPTGATEQHGPYLPTGTDGLIVTGIAERAVAERPFPRSVVIAPTVTVGASDHHFPFGGTLSLTPETLISVLIDLARSVQVCGGRRLAFLNGHGGNQGACRTAAAAAATRFGLSVAYADYWEMLPEQAGGPPVPGHAGAFETSLLLAIQPDLVTERRPREPAVSPPEPPGFSFYSDATWQAIDGYTDMPDRGDAEEGERLLQAIVTNAADWLTQLTEWP